MSSPLNEDSYGFTYSGKPTLSGTIDGIRTHIITSVVSHSHPLNYEAIVLNSLNSSYLNLVSRQKLEFMFQLVTPVGLEPTTPTLKV